MTFYYGEALPVLGRRMIPARVKARKKEKKRKKKKEVQKKKKLIVKMEFFVF